jgi:hypothetical protein
MLKCAIVVLGLAVAAPAGSQPFRVFEQGREAQAAADAMAGRTRDIQITNELSVLQARAQSEQALSNLLAARISPPVPTVPLSSSAPAPMLDAKGFASIPDAALADSNARVRAAANNRR